MGFHAKKRLRFGPLFVYIAWTPGKRLLPRVTSWGWKFGRYTRNITTGRSTYDNPGPGSTSWRHD